MSPPSTFMPTNALNCMSLHPSTPTSSGLKALCVSAVAELAPNAGLLSASTEEAALIDQWACLAKSEINTYTGFSDALAKGYIAPCIKPGEWALQTLNAHFESCAFFVGEHITLTNCAACTKYNHVTHCLETTANQAQLKDIFSPAELAEKALQFMFLPKEKEPKAVPVAPPKQGQEAAEDDEEEPDVPAAPKG
ncbi:hypothetical protein H0H87_002978 [Tephrocybe sp. NHM501043]|nr:hypothetical protein H0H87_002978 [Tephrocybe sp. NHM501043]